jgi:hypothetical protein
MASIGRIAAAAAAALTLAGCATMGVSSYVERSIDFTRYRTYEWAGADALPVGDPRLENNEFFKDYFQGAVDRELGRRGLELAAGRSADLLVHYHASVTREIDVQALEREYRSCRGNDCYPSVLAYEAGTLMIDVVDARTKRLVWRAWAQDNLSGVIDDQDRLRARVEQAVALMMTRWPGTL